MVEPVNPYSNSPAAQSTLSRRRKHLFPDFEEPIASKTLDVSETKIGKVIKFFILANETLFYPFLYTTRAIEAKFGKATASYFLLLLRFQFLNFVCLLLNGFIWLPRVISPPPFSTSYEIGSGLQGINALVTGKGFEFSPLFMGNYSRGNIAQSGYNFEAAWFYTFFTIAFIILVFLAYWLGQAYLKTVSVQSTYTSIERFIFLGWDFSIDDSLQATLKQQSNLIALKELLHVLASHIPKRDKQEMKLSYLNLALTWFLRLVGWLLTLFFLLLGAALIVCTGQQRFRFTQADLDYGILIGFVPSFWHTILESIFPLLNKLERYKVKANELDALLVKYLLMRAVSLISICILITESYLLSKTPPTQDCQLIPFCILSSECRVEGIVGYQCWETQAGKTLYEYIMAQFISSIVFRTCVLSLQNLLRKSIHFCLRTIPVCRRISPLVRMGIEYVLKTEFHVSKHVIKIIYIQCLIWIGMLFSPFITLIGFCGFSLLYITMIVVTKLTSKHSPPPPRISKSNLSYYSILVLMYLIIMILLHWPIFFFTPSEDCGPFRNTTSIYSIFPGHLAQLQSITTVPVIRIENGTAADLTLAVADFWNSPALGPLIIIFLVTSSILISVIRKKNKEISEINGSYQFIFSRYKILFKQELMEVDYKLKQRERLDRRTVPIRASVITVGGVNLLKKKSLVREFTL